jgi:hypothetical protein
MVSLQEGGERYVARQVNKVREAVCSLFKQVGVDPENKVAGSLIGIFRTIVSVRPGYLDWRMSKRLRLA